MIPRSPLVSVGAVYDPPVPVRRLVRLLFWAPEAEIRFVSKRQNVSVVIDGSVISSVVLGEALDSQMREMIRAVAPTIPMVSRGLQPTA